MTLSLADERQLQFAILQYLKSRCFVQTCAAFQNECRIDLNQQQQQTDLASDWSLGRLVQQSKEEVALFVCERCEGVCLTRNRCVFLQLIALESITVYGFVTPNSRQKISNAASVGCEIWQAVRRRNAPRTWWSGRRRCSKRKRHDRASHGGEAKSPENSQASFAVRCRRAQGRQLWQQRFAHCCSTARQFRCRATPRLTMPRRHRKTERWRVKTR